MVKQHCVGHTLFISRKATPLQHNLTKAKFFSASLIQEQKK